MRRSNKLGLPLLLIGIVSSRAPIAAADDPCSKFTWDVTRELSVMQRSSPVVTLAAMSADADLPALEPDRLYELRLAKQESVAFRHEPGKPTLEDGAHGGLAVFKVPKSGRYRISVTSGHWIDVVDGSQLVASRDFQGQRGCRRPAKIVEYDLPGDRELLLQLSGGTDSPILLAITPSP